MNKSILILGAGEGQVPLINCAKNAGWHTIVVSPIGDYPGFELADECVYADISDKEKVLQIADEKQILAIATDQTDVSVPSVLYVAEQLGLPHVDCTSIDNFRYKSYMRKICREQDLPTISSYVTCELEEAKQFYLSLLNKKAIIKPIDSQGSRGVTKVDSIVSLEKAFFNAMGYSRRKEIIIEQFVEGQEIEVDTVLLNGEIKATLIGDVFNFQTINTFSAYERIYPTKFDNAMQDHIIEVNRKTLKALGVRTGWTHGEYIVTPAGEVYLIEVGLRGGGNYIGSDIVRIMLGCGTEEMAFRTAIGDLSFCDDVYLHDAFCAYKCFCLPKGEIMSIDIEEHYLEQEFVVRHNLNKIKVGGETYDCVDKTSRYTVVVKASTREELSSILDDMPNQIKVRINDQDNREGMCVWR